MYKNMPGSPTVIFLALMVTLAGMFRSTSSEGANTGDFSFKPIEESANTDNWDPSAPWKLPEGFTQTIISDEKNLNIYPNGISDYPDMIAINESGPMAGRFMYRTHERKEIHGGAAVSVIDLKTNTSRILFRNVKLNKLDGIRWTPWHTLLVAEEVKGGRLFEITLHKNMVSTVKIEPRPAVGLLAHEGIEVDTDGNVYVVDEHKGLSKGCNGLKPCGGGVYKFVPEKFGDLDKGSLYVLKVSGPDGTGQGEWVGPIDPANARVSGTKMGGQSYQRPEDIEIIGNKLYIAITEGPRGWERTEQYEGRVLSVDLKTLAVRNFIKPGLNVPVEKRKAGLKGHQSGFRRPDNLAESPDGRLVIQEDNSPSDIWFASTQTDQNGASNNVTLFASLADPGAEGSGIYFSNDPYTLYANVMHSAAPDGDGTWAITKIRK